jgi:putative ABC transport system ATP-binding protein
MASDAVIALDRVGYCAGEGALRTRILHDVSASVHAGEIVLLTGPSGSGKTTLLTLIGALRALRQGSLRVLGRELCNASEPVRIAVRREVGYVFQLHNLLRALTVGQNVRTGLRGAARTDHADERVREILARVGLDRHADRRPDALSIGERQRVAVARALVARPRLVLADEPTAALDRQSGRAVVDALARLARESGAAVLLVTHDERIFDVADRVLQMDEGRIAEAAPARRAG